jgi:glycosyltransferase involved in cell wall biosynthesis
LVETLAVGGAEKVAVMMANLFARHGHDVAVAIIRGSEALEPELVDKVKRYRLHRKGRFNLLKMFQLYRIAAKADLVHCHMTGAYRYMALIRRLFFLSKPVIFHDHNGDVDLKIKVGFSLKHFLKPKYYIAVCRALRNWAVQQIGVKEKNAFILENTVPFIQYTGTPALNGRIILVSNFRNTKNIEFAIEISSQLDCGLDIFGMINDREYYESIIELCSQYNVTDKVRLITNADNLRAQLPAYSLAIHTAKSESGPLVLLEYLNAGVPFVAYNTGEVIAHLNNRFPEMVMQNFIVQEWISKINFLLNHKNEELREKLKKIFINEFSDEAYFNKCISIYENILIKEKSVGRRG